MNDESNQLPQLRQCQHRWLIEMPNGPTSQGRCTRCKQTRAFYNDPEAAMISRTAPSPLGPLPLED